VADLEPGTPLVCARGLVKRFGSFTAVDGIDVDIHPGEAFGFLGPNGAGKSSTMRMVAAVSPPTAGTLRVLGLDPVRDGPAVRARLGVVPQEDTLDTELTVRENLVVYARYFGIPRQVARARADELLEFVHLADRAGDRVESLSGGMKRRLTIARSLVNAPQLLMLDEPTTGLDPQARHVVWERLGQLKAAGVTLVLTTHYMDEAEQLCDRLVVMDGGRIVAEGSPAALIARYATREVVEVRAPVGRPGAPRAPIDWVVEAVGADRFAGLVARVEPLPDRLLLYVVDGDAVVALLRDQAEDRGTVLPETGVLVRRASLEDVFLRLTGRSLIE
jgi:lipooligosaccharide transport system ATP-binding protein